MLLCNSTTCHPLNLTLFLFCLLLLSHDKLAEEDCEEDEYWSTTKGHCCNKCHGGFRLEQDCESSNRKSICKPCLNDYYIENSNNAPNCFRCRSCKSNERELSPCTRKKNRQCVCNEGFFKQSISNLTWQCLKCTSCGDGEQERISWSTNRECDCKEKFYRNSNKICEECQCLKAESSSVFPWISGNITMSQLARLTTVHILSLSLSPSDWQLAFVVVVIAFTSVVSYVCFGTLTMRGGPLSAFSACHFIYFLLQHVPASRFKELVRCLGVSERDIEWAERDNHTCKEAQFQMLKVWCDSGRGDEVDTLSRARLQKMTETLRAMGLMAGAEAIEANFQIL
uniref:Tumor necrosis factor receptor superfamily member 1A-like n=1 Tax=Paramormyrops kingsleyae TaxID=1676925 RepID=A0A3B3S033_9TELE